MVKAILSNPKRTDLPPVRVCFPISDYNDVYTKLEATGIGSATDRDCHVAEIIEGPPILKRLEKVPANVDELDYLAKRLDSFDQRELAKFQGVAVSRGYDDITDFINLTFCCQETTVVQNFTDLSAIGREHYMNIHGGITEDELKAVDFRKTALALLLNEPGNITPYGVVYENGMRLEQYYDGRHFPDYDYDCESVMVLEMSNPTEPEDCASITWLRLPVEPCQIEHSMLRAGIKNLKDMKLKYNWSEFPSTLERILTSGGANLLNLNQLCVDYKALGDDGRKKFEAVMEMAAPSSVDEIRNLMAQFDLFDFIPGVFTPEEYGRHMISKSGQFHYDGELDEFYDFKKYGNWRIANEVGQFTSHGYVSYHGFISIDEVMAGSQTERMEMTMGGM